MAQWIMAVFAGITLLILWTSTVIGAAIWLMSRLNELKEEILADFKTKHEENSKKVQAMEVLVMRHDLILEPEFNGSASGYRRAKQ